MRAVTWACWRCPCARRLPSAARATLAWATARACPLAAPPQWEHWRPRQTPCPSPQQPTQPCPSLWWCMPPLGAWRMGGCSSFGCLEGCESVRVQFLGGGGGGGCSASVCCYERRFIVWFWIYSNFFKCNRLRRVRRASAPPWGGGYKVALTPGAQWPWQWVPPAAAVH